MVLVVNKILDLTLLLLDNDLILPDSKIPPMNVQLKQANYHLSKPYPTFLLESPPFVYLTMLVMVL